MRSTLVNFLEARPCASVSTVASISNGYSVEFHGESGTKCGCVERDRKKIYLAERRATPNRTGLSMDWSMGPTRGAQPNSRYQRRSAGIRPSVSFEAVTVGDRGAYATWLGGRVQDLRRACGVYGRNYRGVCQQAIKARHSDHTAPTNWQFKAL
jgi:hypothetical protein